MLCCFALFVCLTLLACFFLPSHLSFKNMYIHVQYHSDARYNERVYTRQRTRLREAANAVTRGGKCVCTRQRTRYREAADANAFTQGSERKRVHTRRQTRLHEAPEANVFARGSERISARQRTRLHERDCTIHTYERCQQLQCYKGLKNNVSNLLKRCVISNN